MKKLLIKIIKKTPLYDPLHNRHAKKQIAKWERKGRPVPPPHIVKQQTLESYAKKFGLRIFIETGTYYGDMVEAMKNNFDLIYSIELSDELYKKAKKRFKKEKQRIELIHGDSGVELRNVMNKINQPALFWLDGHYSAGVTARGAKDTPVYEELENILKAPDMGHVIIIDDARCFGTDPAYPSIEEFNNFIRAKRPDVVVVVQDDSIRITPGQ